MSLAWLHPELNIYFRGASRLRLESAIFQIPSILCSSTSASSSQPSRCYQSPTAWLHCFPTLVVIYSIIYLFLNISHRTDNWGCGGTGKSLRSLPREGQRSRLQMSSLMSFLTLGLTADAAAAHRQTADTPATTPSYSSHSLGSRTARSSVAPLGTLTTILSQSPSPTPPMPTVVTAMTAATAATAATSLMIQKLPQHQVNTTRK